METGTATVTVEILSSAESVVADWEDLASRSGTVFSSRPGFVLNVAGALRLNVRFVVVRRGCRVVALAPLNTVRRGPFVLAKVIGSTLGVPLEFLSDDADASDVLLGAIADRGWMLSGDSMIANDPTVVRMARHGAWDVDAVVRERVPVVVLRPGETASNIRSAKSLKRLRQYRSEVERRSDFRVEEIRDIVHLDARWNDIVTLAAESVEGTDKVNYLVAPHGEFARDFLRSEARAGRLCITGLVVDGRWVAHEIGVRTHRRMEGWLTHYDSSIGKLQPGHQLIEWFADAHDRLGVAELDQGVGVNKIKSVWANAGYDVLRVTAVPRAWWLSGCMKSALRTLPSILARTRSTLHRAAERAGAR
ncbi:GNAT family N-acetyltransferase [Rhodococcus sp. 14-2686-1-2]|nr:GNAT family N-acetyltransferase [Rhodococcus sp. 15-1189-1-1a]OZF18743.1 GNAT family N-acetyltransferase [Rhodococcus sp. 14-2686-1-2]